MSNANRFLFTLFVGGPGADTFTTLQVPVSAGDTVGVLTAKIQDALKPSILPGLVLCSVRMKTTDIPKFKANKALIIPLLDSRLLLDVAVETQWKEVALYNDVNNVAILAVNVDDIISQMTTAQKDKESVLEGRLLNIFVKTLKVDSFTWDDVRLPENKIALQFQIGNNNRPFHTMGYTFNEPALGMKTLFEKPRALRFPEPTVPTNKNNLLYIGLIEVLQDLIKNSFKKLFVEGPAATGDLPTVDSAELVSYGQMIQNIAVHFGQAISKSSFAKEDCFAAVADPALWRVNASGLTCQYDKGVGWAPPLFVYRSGSTDHVKYGPRNDFRIASPSGPLLLVEIVSDEEKESDRARLLLQAAVACRLLYRSRKTENALVFAIYVNRDLESEWYCAYKTKPFEDTVTIEFFRKFDLRDAVDACTHLAYLFNYVFFLSTLAEGFVTPDKDKPSGNIVSLLGNSSVYKDLKSLTTLK